MNIIQFEELIGQTMTSVEVNDDKDEMVFTRSDGLRAKFYHQQDCCEVVSIEDICGDLEDLVGAPILVAEEIHDQFREFLHAGNRDEYSDESSTWTFYRYATIKGSVTVRWYGSSNGYYSESVDYDVEDPNADLTETDVN
jgi:hypothetical protein